MSPRESVEGSGATDRTTYRGCNSSRQRGVRLPPITALRRRDHGVHRPEAKALAERKRVEVHLKLADLERLESTLTTLVRARLPQKRTLTCPLIASLHGNGNLQNAPGSGAI